MFVTSWSLQAGVDIYRLARILGHRDIRMTKRYAHHNSESLRDGVEVLDKINADLSRFYHTGPKNEEKGLRRMP